MILFSNGCSFLTNRPKDGVDTFTTKILAEQYKMALCNFAMGGRGNDRISFTTKVWLERHKRDKYFAVIGWSSQNRNDYVSNFNWLAGWFQNYFFNKVSDFLLGIIFTVMIFYTTYFRYNLKKATCFYKSLF